MPERNWRPSRQKGGIGEIWGIIKDETSIVIENARLLVLEPAFKDLKYLVGQPDSDKDNKEK